MTNMNTHYVDWNGVWEEIRNHASRLSEDEKKSIREKFKSKTWYDALLEKHPEVCTDDIYLDRCPGEFFYGAPDLFSGDIDFSYECKGVSCDKCWKGDYIEYEQ